MKIGFSYMTVNNALVTINMQYFIYTHVYMASRYYLTP